MARTTPVHSGYTIYNGTGTGTNGSRIDVWVEYLIGSPNVAANTTPFTAYFYAALRAGQTSSTSSTYGMYSKFSVDGVSGTVVESAAYDFRSSSINNFLGSYSGNIAHNSDGSKTIQISGSFTTPSSYISGGSVSFSLVLPIVPRASTIGATDANIGSVSIIAVSKKSSAFTHSIKFTFGSASGYVNASGGVSSSEVKLSDTSIPFTVPTSFYAQIPNAPSGICTLTCTTYSGDTKIGDPTSSQFQATASYDSSYPLVSGTVVDTNSATKALTGDANKLVRYMSTALCTISAGGRNSASIAAKKIAGNTVTENTLSISKVEVSSFSFYAKDSRGYEASTDVDKTLIPYVILTAIPSVYRPNPTDGSAVISVRGNYFNGSFGASDNSLTVRYRIDGGSWVNISPTLNGNTYTASASLSGMDYLTQYSVDIQVSDKLDAIDKSEPLKRGKPIFDFGPDDFAVNVKFRPEGSISPKWHNASSNETISSAVISAYENCQDGCIGFSLLSVNAVGLELLGGLWFLTIYKNTASYGTVFAVSYHGSPCTVMCKKIYNGSWSGWVSVLGV